MSEYPHFRKDSDQVDLLLATTDIGLWELDMRTGDALRNLRHDQIFGYDKLLDTWTSEMFLAHVADEDRERVRGLLESSATRSGRWVFETKINRADGAKRWIRANSVQKRAETGELLKLVGNVIDITDIKTNEEQLRLVTRELNHRVKNTLAIVQSIAQQTFPPDNATVPHFLHRLQALSTVHDVLLGSAWESADLHRLVRDILQMGGDSAMTIAPDSPAISLSSDVAIAFTMAFHELCTNAIKYGALSVAEGLVHIGWFVSETPKILTITWSEQGGPEPASERTPGFGTTVITNALAFETGATVKMTFAPEGMQTVIRVPLDAVKAS